MSSSKRQGAETAAEIMQRICVQQWQRHSALEPTEAAKQVNQADQLRRAQLPEVRGHRRQRHPDRTVEDEALPRDSSSIDLLESDQVPRLRRRCCLQRSYGRAALSNPLRQWQDSAATTQTASAGLWATVSTTEKKKSGQDRF